MTNNVSFLHLNVQSLKPKLDLVSAEYGHFDILSFTETWFNHSTSDRDVKLSVFNIPLRKSVLKVHIGYGQ